MKPNKIGSVHVELIRYEYTPGRQGVSVLIWRNEEPGKRMHVSGKGGYNFSSNDVADLPRMARRIMRGMQLMAASMRRTASEVASSEDTIFARPHARPETQANARLIAAAPDLLDALKAILYDLNQPNPYIANCRVIARSAIAKATEATP